MYAHLSPCESRSSAKDSPKDVATPNVVGNATVTESEGECADVICNDTVGGIDAVLVFIAELARVWPNPSQLLDLLEEREENVRVVVRTLVLDNGDETLEAHAGVNMFRRERLEGAVIFAIELDEDVVPDL